MSGRYKILEKDGAKHLVEEGIFCDYDKGQLHETLLGDLETRNIIGEDFKLKDEHPIIAPGTEYNVNTSGGQQGELKQWLDGKYDYTEASPATGIEAARVP